MREIKFRGKSLRTGKWVYGSLVRYGDGRVEIYTLINPRDENSLRAWLEEVDPATVGQYTGLKDKNGKEIYEEDIITAYNERIKGPVIFDRRGLAFGIPNGPNEIYQFSMNFLESKDIEIIGNIYENPEMKMDKLEPEVEEK